MRFEIHRRVKLATILFAWACFAAGPIVGAWWLIALGFAPYLLWNQVPRHGPSGRV